MNSVLPFYEENFGGARQLVRNHGQTGAVAPSENGRLPPFLAHQLASAYKNSPAARRRSPWAARGPASLSEFPMNSPAGAFDKLPLPGSASGCFGNGVAYGRQRITARDRQEYVESRYMPTRSGRRPRKRADSPTGSGKPVTNDEVASSRDHVAKRALRHQYSKRPEPATATTSVTGQDIAQRVTWLKTSSRAVGEPGTGASVAKEPRRIPPSIVYGTGGPFSRNCLASALGELLATDY